MRKRYLDNKKTKTMKITNIFREHLQRAIFETIFETKTKTYQENIKKDIKDTCDLNCSKFFIQVDEEKKVEAVSDFYKSAATSHAIANYSAEWLLNAGSRHSIKKV